MKSIGDRGEACVAAVLARRGWKILLRNWRDRYAEVDMVALAPDNSLHLIEIKARARISTPWGHLLETVRPAQIRRIRSALARLQSALPPCHWTSVHVDAAFVLLAPRAARVHFLPDCYD